MKKLPIILVLCVLLIGITYAEISSNRQVEVPKDLMYFSKSVNNNFNYTIQEYGEQSLVCIYKIIGTGKDAKKESIKCKRVDNKLIDETIKTIIISQLEKEKRIKDRKNVDKTKSKDLVVGTIELKQSSIESKT